MPLPDVTLGLVFHVDSPERWPLLLGNLRNTRAARPELSLRVIANGSAPVALWANGQWRRDAELLMRDGVSMAFCQNSLGALGLEAHEAPTGSELVPAGTVALVEAQTAGFAYLKP